MKGCLGFIGVKGLGGLGFRVLRAFGLGASGVGFRMSGWGFSSGFNRLDFRAVARGLKTMRSGTHPSRNYTIPFV